VEDYEIPEELDEDYLKIENGKSSNRTRYTSFSAGPINVVFKTYNNFIAHYNSTDLSILDDFIHFQDFLNIIGRSYATVGSGFEVCGCRIIVRDTVLLAPANTSLKDLSKIYSGFHKKDVSAE
jgi:hypothetical protein